MVYFECYEGNKLIHIDRSLQDPGALEEYKKEFPERTIKRVDKEFFHHIKIYTSEEATYCSACKLIGKIRVSEKAIRKLLKIPHLGCGSGPTGGIYSLTFAKIHIKKVMGFDEKQGHLSLLDF